MQISAPEKWLKAPATYFVNKCIEGAQMKGEKGEQNPSRNHIFLSCRAAVKLVTRKSLCACARVKYSGPFRSDIFHRCCRRRQDQVVSHPADRRLG
jgi:hypothetical protein